MNPDATLAPTGLSRSISNRIGSFVAAVRAHQRARRDQTRLSHMSDQLINDIGLTRDDVRYIGRIPYDYR